jgi:hypothetical protein
MYPCHIWFWFCGCFPKFLTHFFDKKCWSTRLDLGVRHQKRRNSGKDVHGYDRGVGQSDALTYSHPIDHSNDRYRERFFSFRNGFGPKIPVERPKSTIFRPMKRARLDSCPDGDHVFHLTAANGTPPTCHPTHTSKHTGERERGQPKSPPYTTTGDFSFLNHNDFSFQGTLWLKRVVVFKALFSHGWAMWMLVFAEAAW